MTSTDPWKQSVAIVTGGSSGIGRATALALAARGASVLVTGRNPQRLEALGSHERLETLAADSAEPDTAERVVHRALERWGRIDLVVNNAGAGHPMPLNAYDGAAITQMSNVNILAPSLLVRAAQPALRESQGAIVNISTAVTQGAAPLLAHYAATKAALEHLTRSWAIELAPDQIRVNGIAPGPVESGALTGMMGLPPEVARQVETQEAAQIPLGRRGTPDDIVPWILHLGGPTNRWTTGQVLTIDGGWTLRS